jgi:beta-phosphoglucomutase
MAVENAPLGIRSAKAAGMTCVAVETTLPAVDLNEADYCIPDIDHLFDIPILHALVG